MNTGGQNSELGRLTYDPALSGIRPQHEGQAARLRHVTRCKQADARLFAANVPAPNEGVRFVLYRLGQ